MGSSVRYEADDVAQLHALAAGLAQVAGIRITVSESEWSWNSAERVLTVAADSLRTYGPLYCAGFVGHEVAHIFVSRYQMFRMPANLTLDAAANLLNALEDPRAEHWIGQRYPGVSQWLAPIRQATLQRKIPQQLPDFLKFCLECTREPHREWRPAPKGELPGVVIDALDRTRLARRACQAELPPCDWGSGNRVPPVDTEYLIQVVPALRKPGRDQAQSNWEMLVQYSAWRAFSIAVDQVFPVVAELWDQDVDGIAAAMAASAELEGLAEAALTEEVLEALLALLGRLGDQRTGTRTPPDDRRKELAKALLLRLLRILQRKLSREAEGIGLGRGPGRGVGTGSLREPPHRVEGHGVVPKTYQTVLQEVQPQVSRLVKELEMVLLPQRRLRDRSGYPSGSRVDLRRLMAFDADPREYRNLWRRKTVPDRHRTIVSLLIDLSGSMAHSNDEAAMAGAVVLAETLSRLGIDFSIDGFQDELIALCPFGMGITAEVRRNLEEIPLEARGERPNGRNAYEYNDDAPCLAEAAEHLLDRLADERFLIVISDGGPSGRRSTAEDLKRTVTELEARSDLYLIGVGIGPNTEHVNEYYRHAIANVPVDGFAERLGDLLRRLVVKGAGAR